MVNLLVYWWRHISTDPPPSVKIPPVHFWCAKGKVLRNSRTVWNRLETSFGHWLKKNIKKNVSWTVKWWRHFLSAATSHWPGGLRKNEQFWTSFAAGCFRMASANIWNPLTHHIRALFKAVLVKDSRNTLFVSFIYWALNFQREQRLRF